jgi:hypothetical protein
MPATICLEETLNVGSDTYFESVSPQGRYGVVFEDNKDTGYFYALDMNRNGQENPILDALHIVNVQSVVDRDIPSTLQIAWSDDGLKAALIINKYLHAVFDFEAKRGYCRSSFPPPDERWTEHGHQWDDSVMELFK